MRGQIERLADTDQVWREAIQVNIGGGAPEASECALDAKRIEIEESLNLVEQAASMGRFEEALEGLI